MSFPRPGSFFSPNAPKQLPRLRELRETISNLPVPVLAELGGEARESTRRDLPSSETSKAAQRPNGPSVDSRGGQFNLSGRQEVGLPNGHGLGSRAIEPALQSGVNVPPAHSLPGAADSSRSARKQSAIFHEGSTATRAPRHSFFMKTIIAIAIIAGMGLIGVSAVNAVDPPPVGGYPNDNTALGDSALFSLTDGFYNVGLGRAALYYTTTGEANTAVGSFALLFNTTGGFNAAFGDNALFHNTGQFNTALGALALEALTTGTNNIAVGHDAGTNYTTESNNITIGDPGVASESNTIRLGRKNLHGKVYIQGISTSPIANAVPVCVRTNGQIGTCTGADSAEARIYQLEKQVAALTAIIKARQ